MIIVLKSNIFGRFICVLFRKSYYIFAGFLFQLLMSDMCFSEKNGGSGSTTLFGLVIGTKGIFNLSFKKTKEFN